MNELSPIYESARIKPAVVQVEAHPYLPETKLLEFCKQKDIVVFGFCAVGSRYETRAARRSGHHFGDRRTSWQDAGPGALGLGGTTWHGSAHNAQNRGSRAREFQHLPLFQKTRLMKSIESRLDRGSMK